MADGAARIHSVPNYLVVPDSFELRGGKGVAGGMGCGDFRAPWCHLALVTRPLVYSGPKAVGPERISNDQA